VKKEEVIERLCILASQVATVKFHNSIPADCFCGETKFSTGNAEIIEVSPEVIAFIEAAVQNKLKFDQTKEKLKANIRAGADQIT